MRKYLFFATALLLLAFAVMLASRAQGPRSGGLLREFRPIGGVNNNLMHPQFNAVPGSAELAIAPLRFADPLRLDPMGGPNARVVSNMIAGGASGSGDDSQTTDPVASAWLYVFGQFVDHDLGLESSSPTGPRIDIAVPKGDPFFPQGTVIELTRDISRARSPIRSSTPPPATSTCRSCTARAPKWPPACARPTAR